ncbi:MAG: chromosomal replication initiator protein DnaA, partial [Bacteroidetes bacterium]
MKDQCKIVWDNCLSIIKDNITAKGFNTWFKPIKPIKLENNVLTIQVPSQFFYEWLEEKYIGILKRTIKRELGESGKLEYSIVMDSGNSLGNVIAPAQQPEHIENQPVNVGSHMRKKIHNPFVIPG